MLRCIIARRRSLYMFVSEHSCVALVNCRKGVCRRRATLRGQALPLAANTFGLSIHAIDKATCYFARSSSSARAMCVGVQRYGQHAHRLCAVYRCRRVRAAIVSFAERNSHGASRTAIPRHRDSRGGVGLRWSCRRRRSNRSCKAHGFQPLLHGIQETRHEPEQFTRRVPHGTATARTMKGQ
jgi:hypothetical protein